MDRHANASPGRFPSGWSCWSLSSCVRSRCGHQASRCRSSPTTSSFSSRFAIAPSWLRSAPPTNSATMAARSGVRSSSGWLPSWVVSHRWRFTSRTVFCSWPRLPCSSPWYVARSVMLLHSSRSRSSHSIMPSIRYFNGPLAPRTCWRFSSHWLPSTCIAATADGLLPQPSPWHCCPRRWPPRPCSSRRPLRVLLPIWPRVFARACRCLPSRPRGSFGDTCTETTHLYTWPGSSRASFTHCK